MNTTRIMIQDEADGVHKHRGLRLSAKEKWKNGTQMCKMDLKHGRSPDDEGDNARMGHHHSQDNMEVEQM
ncbi:hypothetical protein BDR03DRAFT_1012710 [Suillus americanus]|nr:hypothetical protein BDR03DRAFT_1012710 [Suillus americanus]